MEVQEEKDTFLTPVWAAEPVFVLVSGKAPPTATRKDDNSMIRTPVVLKDRPGDHEGEGEAELVADFTAF